MFATNALFPIEVMLHWLAVISKINPVTYAVDPIRELSIHGWNWGKILPGAWVISELTIVFMLVSQMAFQRTMSEQTRRR
jgi:ABC-2 type transport system permease protein